jgi:hypothetical protein
VSSTAPTQYVTGGARRNDDRRPLNTASTHRRENIIPTKIEELREGIDAMRRDHRLVEQAAETFLSAVATCKRPSTA